MRIRWANLKTVSNDKGPYKLATFEADKHQFTAQIVESYGIQGNPPEGSQALIIPVDGDEGKMIAFVMPPPKDRMDGLKPGETGYKNHVVGQETKFDKDGNVVTTASGNNTETFGGDQRITTGGIVYINC